LSSQLQHATGPDDLSPRRLIPIGKIGSNHRRFTAKWTESTELRAIQVKPHIRQACQRGA
jgi:hypothetical protein